MSGKENGAVMASAFLSEFLGDRLYPTPHHLAGTRTAGALSEESVLHSVFGNTELKGSRLTPNRSDFEHGYRSSNPSEEVQDETFNSFPVLKAAPKTLSRQG